MHIFIRLQKKRILKKKDVYKRQILSSQAQEESRNVSENCHWGIVRKFEDGKVIVNHSKFMGYTKDEDGNLVIVLEEAEVVRRIFRLFLEGNSSYRIKRILEADGVKTATGQTTWSVSYTHLDVYKRQLLLILLN